ncbi:MAG: IS1182 family transposase [Armatimonadota bacterium]
MPRFKEMPQDPKQIWLMSPSLDDMISEDNEVRALSEVMDSLDWKILEDTYVERGAPAYPPKVMAKILVFAYSNGIRSSRKIEELLASDVRYMWLAGCLKPDFHTIARFRKEKFESLSRLFADSVRLCKSLGLLNLNIAAFDGTKVSANASKRSLYDRKRIDKELEAARKILEEADDVDANEDAKFGEQNGRKIPEHLRDAKKRKEALEELKKKLNASNSKLISSSDTDCRLMKTRDGFRPAFNVQAAVDSEHQVVLGMQVTNSENDHGQLPGMLAEVKTNCGMSAVMALADTGYCDEKTLLAFADMGQDALIAQSRKLGKTDKNNLFDSKCFLADDERDVLICPAGRELNFAGEYQCGSGRYRLYSAHGCVSCSFRNRCVKSGRGSRRVSISCKERFYHRMREKMSRPGCKTLYGLRKQIIEPVFGQVKHNRGFRKFLLRGVNGATAEMALIFLVHNLLKCIGKAAISSLVACFSSIDRFIHLCCRRIGELGMCFNNSSYLSEAF